MAFGFSLFCLTNRGENGIFTRFSTLNRRVLTFREMGATPLTTAVLNRRKREVLEAIINCYNQTAKPVSSRTIARQYGMKLSPATIRSTMAQLGEFGYLSQPHTSAGRIPTELGYRVYVDNMMKTQRLSDEERRFIRQWYTSSKLDFEETIEQTSKILSEISHYIGVALSPQLHEGILRRLELIPLDTQRVIVVLITTSGLVKNQVFSIQESLSNADIYRISRILNEKLAGLSLGEIQQISRSSKKLKAIFERDLSDPVVVLTRNAFSLDREIHVYLDGTSNFFGQPEFLEVEQIEPLFRFLEQKDRVADLLSPQKENPEIQVLIGSENRCEGMEMCSIVQSAFRVRGDSLGTIGVIGPTRMEYSRVVSIVKFTAQVIGQHLRKSP